MIQVGEDYVTILDEHGQEIVHWIQDEWEEDPSVTIAIANAIHLYYTRGSDYLKTLLSLKGKKV